MQLLYNCNCTFVQRKFCSFLLMSEQVIASYREADMERLHPLLVSFGVATLMFLCALHLSEQDVT